MTYKAFIVFIVALAVVGAGGFIMGRNPNPQAGGFSTNGFASSTLTAIPVPISAGGTNKTSQTTNGVCYFDGTLITCSTGVFYNGTSFAIGSTTPLATLQLTPTGSNATTSAEFGKAGQTTGSCITYFSATGTPVYAVFNNGAAAPIYTATQPSGCTD